MVSLFDQSNVPGKEKRKESEKNIVEWGESNVFDCRGGIKSD